MMRISLSYDSESGELWTSIETEGDYNPDALDDMVARATKCHKDLMATAVALLVPGDDVEPVVTEDTVP